MYKNEKQRREYEQELDRIELKRELEGSRSVEELEAAEAAAELEEEKKLLPASTVKRLCLRLIPRAVHGGELEEAVRWSLARWFVILRLRLKKVFKKWGFHGVKRARH